MEAEVEVSAEAEERDDEREEACNAVEGCLFELQSGHVAGDELDLCLILGNAFPSKLQLSRGNVIGDNCPNLRM